MILTPASALRMRRVSRFCFSRWRLSLGLLPRGPWSEGDDDDELGLELEPSLSSELSEESLPGSELLEEEGGLRGGPRPPAVVDARNQPPSGTKEGSRLNCAGPWGVLFLPCPGEGVDFVWSRSLRAFKT